MEISSALLKKWGACSGGKEWFEAQKETDGVKVVKKLIKENHLDWANWTICQIFTDEQKRKYSVFAAEQVAYLWKDKYPKEYGIWKKWVDDGCPERGRIAARAAADAAWAAAWTAAWAAAWTAARAAADAARAAAWAAAWTAARTAAWTAARAAARAAAWDARAAAGDAMMLKILNYGMKLLEER